MNRNPRVVPVLLFILVVVGLVVLWPDRQESPPGEQESVVDMGEQKSPPGQQQPVLDTGEPEFVVNMNEQGVPLDEQEPVDPDTWHVFGDHAYRLTPEPMEWHAAEAAARELGGHLVAIETAEENDWLVATFGGHAEYWIGLTDEAVEGEFRWTSGAKMEYSNWRPGEPNDEFGREDWVFMNFIEPGLWNDHLGFRRRRWGWHFGIVEVTPDDAEE